jgi:hypothetical protein
MIFLPSFVGVAYLISIDDLLKDEDETSVEY